MLSCTGSQTVRNLPEIEVWYGKRQYFGYSGVPQHWVNILGRVCQEGGKITSLEYCLNNQKNKAGKDSLISLFIGPQPDSIVPRRLMQKGDFNIELDVKNLKNGMNSLQIIAENCIGLKAKEIVSFDFDGMSGKNDTINPDWSTGINIQRSLQIIDGKWQWDQNGIRTTEPGYDRILAFGDTLWSDVDIYAEVVLNRIPDTLECPGMKRDGTGFGFLIHWLGHSDDPVPGMKPKCGWFPSGGDCWYVAEQAVGEKEFGNVLWQIDSYPSDGKRGILKCEPLVLGKSYNVRMQYKTIDGNGNYRLKIWAVENMEPVYWHLTETAADNNLKYGSVLFVAHYVDATLKKIVAKPLI
jgi:hypothetical protein